MNACSNCNDLVPSELMDECEIHQKLFCLNCMCPVCMAEYVRTQLTEDLTNEISNCLF